MTQRADKMLVKGSGGNDGTAHELMVLVVRDEHLAHFEGGIHVGPHVGGFKVAAEGYALGDVGGGYGGAVVGRTTHEPVAHGLVAEEVAPQIGEELGAVTHVVGHNGRGVGHVRFREVKHGGGECRKRESATGREFVTGRDEEEGEEWRRYNSARDVHRGRGWGDCFYDAEVVRECNFGGGGG